MKRSLTLAASILAITAGSAVAQTAAPSPSGDAAAKSDGSSKQTAPANTTKGSGDSSSGASTGTAGTDPSLSKQKTAPVNGKTAEPNSQTDKTK